MLDLNRVLFYKASLEIEAVIGDDVLWPVVYAIKTWMTAKWRNTECSLPEENRLWGALMHRGRIESADPDKSVSVESAMYLDGISGNHWACAVSETIREEGCASREWRSEFGFTWTSNLSGTLSIVLTYGDQPGFLGAVQPAPNATVPGIIRRLNSNNRIKCTVSGRELALSPIQLFPGQFFEFWSFVSDRERNVPVVFVSPFFSEEGCSLFVDPLKLANSLGPTAVVYYSTERDFMAEMNACLPSEDLRCANGTIRIYSPGKSMSEPWRHRFFNRQAIESLGGEDAVISLLRRAFAQDVHFYEKMIRLEDVKSLIRRSSFKNQQLLRVSDAQEKTDEIQSEFNEFLESYEVALRTIEHLEAEKEKLAREKNAAEAKACHLEQAVSLSGCNLPDKPSVSLYPSTNKEVVNLFLESYPDRFDLTKRAWKSLEDCGASIEVLWNALYYTCTLLYSLWKDDSCSDIEASFNSSASGFEYKRGEGRQSRSDKNLMSSRSDTYDGRTIFAEPHISKGNFKGKAKDKSIRLYLAFDEPSGMIILSSIGGHLDNFSTQHNK